MPTKEQVLKRLAEIEGVTLPVDCKCECHRGPMHEAMNIQHVVACCALGWNPLDTPSDWAVLIEKYRPNLFFWDSEYFSEKYRGKWTAEIGSVETVHESLPWAICLAIIESKGGMGDE